MIRSQTKAKLAKASNAKPRVLVSSAPFVRHEGPRIAGLPIVLASYMEEVIMWKRFAFCLAITILVSAGIGSAVFAAEKYDVTANEVFDPYGSLGLIPVGYYVYPPTVKCPGNEPTGIDAQPCPDGSRMHLRNLVYVCQVSSADGRMSGMMTVEANVNWNADFEGPLWGTFSIALDSGGSWEGTWQGLRERQDVNYWTGMLHVIGKGYGGEVDGMKLMAEDRLESFTPMPVVYLGYIDGRIVDPN